MEAHLKTTTIFINGVAYGSEIETRDLIEGVLGYKVELIHHSTTLVRDVVNNPDGPITEQKVTELRSRLVELIKLDYRVLLIVHSKGAHIALKGLSRVKEEDSSGLRRCVTVYAYGGICYLPSDFGKSVCNVWNTGDNAVLFRWKPIGSSPSPLWEAFTKQRVGAFEEITRWCDSPNDYCNHMGALMVRVVKKICNFHVTELGSGHSFLGGYDRQCQEDAKQFMKAVAEEETALQKSFKKLDVQVDRRIQRCNSLLRKLGSPNLFTKIITAKNLDAAIRIRTEEKVWYDDEYRRRLEEWNRRLEQELQQGQLIKQKLDHGDNRFQAQPQKRKDAPEAMGESIDRDTIVFKIQKKQCWKMTITLSIFTLTSMVFCWMTNAADRGLFDQ
ncbi:MAG: hypothetical protein AB7M93_25840 [Candidatus Obscuribacterales bacterium]